MNLEFFRELMKPVVKSSRKTLHELGYKEIDFVITSSTNISYFLEIRVEKDVKRHKYVVYWGKAVKAMMGDWHGEDKIVCRHFGMYGPKDDVIGLSEPKYEEEVQKIIREQELSYWQNPEWRIEDNLGLCVPPY